MFGEGIPEQRHAQNRALEWRQLALALALVICGLLGLSLQVKSAQAQEVVPAFTQQEPQQACTTYINGDITTHTTWTPAGSPYCVQVGIAVNANVTLTIQPAVEVRFATDRWLTVRNGGALVAEGTSAQPITFTSQAATPAVGDWRHIRAEAGSRVRLRDCDIGYGGRNNEGVLRITGSDVQVQDCRIHDGLGVGIFLEGVGLTPTFENVEIDGCTGAAIYQTTPNMRPTYLALNIHDNGTDALRINGAPFLNQAVTWDGPNLGGASVDIVGSLILDSGGALTVTAGTTVRMWTGVVQIRNGGALYAQGVAGQPVVFTSQASTPAPGDWVGIDAWQSGGRLRADYLDLRYAGRDQARSLRTISSDVQVRHSRIHDGLGVGIFVEWTGLTPTFEDVEIDGCTGAAIYQTTPNMSPTYLALNIHDNGTDALRINGAPFLNQAVTWDGPNLGGASVDIVGSLILDSGGALTVTAGATVRLPSGQKVQIRNGGALYVRGAAAQPVRFTSQAASPSPGSWLGIEVWQAGARLDAEHLDLAYAGREDTQSLLVKSSDVSIRDSRIHHGLASGITMVGDDLTPAFRRLEIDHVTGAAVFQDRLNQSPIFEDIWAHDNGFDGLAIYNFGGALTWAKTLDVSGFRGEPVVRLGRMFQISGPAASLEIPPGLTLEFDWGAIYVMNGARLDARGTVTQPITFTSAHADKQPGQWDGIIIFSPESVTSPVYLEYCDIGYAGGNNHASVWIQGAGNAHVEINHCQIHDSSAMGIAIQDGGPNNFVRIAHTAIVDTAENGIDVDWAYPPLLAVNTLERNGLYAIHYQRGVYPPLEAYYHYWGHPSGPYHPSLNPTGVGGRVSDGVLFDPWSDGRANVSVAPEAVAPAPGEALTTPPIRFRMVSHDPDDWQKLYYQVEILQGGVRQALYDQRVSTDGWDRAFYAPGITATLTLRNILPNGAYTWRVAVFDGHEEVWSSEERPFTVALGVAFAVTGLTPEEVLGRPNVPQTFTLHGLGFVNGLAQVRVERRLWDDAVQTLTPVNVQVVSPTQITFGLNLTGASGPWEVIVTQGASEARTPLFIYPYMPVFSYRYASPEILAADRLQEHTMELTNWGSADGIAIVGIYSPKDALLTVPVQVGVEYLGSPFSRMHLLAVQANANAGRDVRLQWKMPWSAINPPGQPPDPALYDQGAPLRYKFAVVGQLSTEAWNALKAEAPGDIQQQVYLAAWGGALAEGFAADAYLDAADRTLAHDYIERLGAVYPSIADALVLRQYDDFMLALYDAIDYPLPEVSGGTAPAGIENGVFRSWLERAVGDPWEFTKTFFTGFDDVISSGQAGAFFVAEMEGLVEGLTFGLFRPSFGAKTMAHVAGLDPGAIGIGRFIGNMLSIPLGPGSGKLAGKGVGNVLRGAHTALKPTEDVYLAWNRLKLTIAGTANEPQRWGLSVISKNRDLPLIHWGNNPRYGGFHWALGWEGKRVPGNLTGGLGEELYGAGLHFYENHMYVPDAFLQGVPFLHVIEDKALRQYFNVIKEATFTDIQLMSADIGDYLFPPAVPPQDDALCNQGAQTLRFAWDPNAIEGTPRASHILPSQEIGLLIRFENLISATLPAEDIAVTLPIHPNLDWDSIRLGDASHAFTVQTNPVERTLTWRFDDINLPPNANPPAGEGWIRLSVFPSATLTTGQQIAETAMIVFDANPPMWTNVITYTIDLAPPSVELAVAERGEPGARAVINATDNPGGSGVALVGLEYSADGANWVQGSYLTAITPTAAITGAIPLVDIRGGHYWLRAYAQDAIGNIGPLTTPVEADAPQDLYLYLPLVADASQGMHLYLPLVVRGGGGVFGTE